MPIQIINKTVLIFTLLFLCGCASKGFVTDKFDPDFYRVPSLLPNDQSDINPVFIVYGDTQPSWRIYHKFIQKDNWLTPKMLLLPFYQLNLLANGVVGLVNRVRLLPDYGCETRLMMRDEVYNEAKNSDIDFILNTGDIMGQDGRRPSNWKIFLEENNQQHPLLKEIPYMPTPGNHERCNDTTYGRKNFDAVFNFPLFYVTEFKDAAIFVVDSDVIIDFRSDTDDDEQDRLFEKWFVSNDPQNPGWLERELSQCTKTFKIVSIHHCPLSFGRHWKDWYDKRFGQNILDKRRRLLELFGRYGVQLVFSGHDHIYQHNVLSFEPENGSQSPDIHFVVSSGGGVPIRGVSSDRKKESLRNRYLSEGYSIDPVLGAGVHHYCVVSVTPGEITVRTIMVPKEEPSASRIFEEFVIAGVN